MLLIAFIPWLVVVGAAAIATVLLTPRRAGRNETNRNRSNTPAQPQRGSINYEQDRYLSFDACRESNESYTARHVVLDCLTRDSPGFLRRLFDGESYDSITQQRYLRVLADVMPGLVIGSYSRYQDLPGANSILSLAGRNDPEAAIHLYERYRNAPDAEQILRDAIEREPVRALVFPETYRTSPNAEEHLERAARLIAERMPYFAIRRFDRYRDRRYAQEVLRTAVINASIIDPESVLQCRELFQNQNYAEEAIRTAETLIRIRRDLLNQNNIRDRVQYLQNQVQNINPNFQQALAQFNRDNNLSLEFQGIHYDPLFPAGPYQFVLINTFGSTNQEPLRIGLTYNELRNARTPEQITNLLRQKLDEQRQSFASQYSLWENEHNYDLPQNDIAIMMVGVFGDRNGQETDFARLLEIYSGHYGGTISAVCMADRNTWENTPRIQANIRAGHIPPTGQATRQEILTTLRRSLEGAIDSGRSTFLFHYMMHGGQDGTMAASDGTITPQDIAQVLATNYNGRALCDQIDINIVADSCFSGMQMERIISYLENWETPVRSLRIISSTNLTHPSTMSLTEDNASLTSDRMRGDWSGAFPYYFSYYYELLEHQREQGIEIQAPFGTFAHAVRFADLMSSYDSIHGARPRAFHYSYNPQTNRRVNQYFSQLGNISENNGINIPNQIVSC